MTYNVGDHIDLSYINSPAVLVKPVKKQESINETFKRLYDVGTKIVFNEGKAAIKVNVVFA